MSPPVLRLCGVTLRRGSRPAVENFSLEVAPAEVLAVLGPSGSGKTTFLRLVAGLEVPDEGEIWLDGRQVARGGRNLVPPNGRAIGFVFQDLALWPHLSVREQLAFAMGSVGVPRAERRRRVQETLSLVRLDGLADRYPHEMSGGEQQRAALARALAGRPRLLLLDEPFSNLDFELRAALRSELSSLQRALMLTTIYVTHDREDAAALAHRIVSMRSGRIEAVRTVTQAAGSSG